MNFKSYLLVSLASMALANVSCKKDDKDENKYAKTDPRIETVMVRGETTTFIVNEVEHLIFNYDSLPYGTDITSKVISFYGYDAAPSIQVLKNGVWVDFPNNGADSTKLDLTNLKIRTLSVDGSNSYEYTLDVRVHKFDASAFNWTAASSLPVVGEVASSRSVYVAGNIHYFYTNTLGESYVLSSADGEKWTSTALSGTFNWSSLTALNSKCALIGEDGILLLDPANGFTSETVANDANLKDLLFFYGNKYWAVSDDALYATASLDSSFEKVADLPVGFPTGKLSSLVSLTGTKTQIGYIYGNDGRKASLWAVDEYGNLLQITTTDKGNLPVLNGAALVSVSGEIGLVGGTSVDGSLCSTYYSSSNSGLSWSDNWHKSLPEAIGSVSNIGAFSVSNSKLVLVGGDNAKGPSLSVWNAVLKGAK